TQTAVFARQRLAPAEDHAARVQTLRIRHAPARSEELLERIEVRYLRFVVAVVRRERLLAVNVCQTPQRPPHPPRVNLILEHDEPIWLLSEVPSVFVSDVAEMILAPFGITFRHEDDDSPVADVGGTRQAVLEMGKFVEVAVADRRHV